MKKVIGAISAMVLGVQVLEVSAMNMDHSYGRMSLLEASINGHLSTVVSLINEGANIEATDPYGYMPLLTAAMKGHQSTDVHSQKLLATACIYHYF